MGDLATIDLVGYWLGIFLTFCILSFLYKDNPFYKLAEHLFIGVSIGYVVMKQFYDTIQPKLLGNLFAGDESNYWYIIAAVLAMALLTKLSSRWAWVGRYPIAFVVGFYAGLQVNGVVQGDLAGQLPRAMASVVVEKVDVNKAPPEEMLTLPGFNPLVAEAVMKRRAERPFGSVDELATMPELSAAQQLELSRARGSFAGLDARARAGKPNGSAWNKMFLPGEQGGTESRAFESLVVHDTEYYWFGIFSQLLLLFGLIAGLVYFYFSVEQKGVVGRISRVGIWVLMIGFGASFGYTVQGRLSLAIGRSLDISGHNKDPLLAEQIHGPLVALISLGVIIAGLVVWEQRNRTRLGGPPAPGSDDDSPSEA